MIEYGMFGIGFILTLVSIFLGFAKRDLKRARVAAIMAVVGFVLLMSSIFYDAIFFLITGVET